MGQMESVSVDCFMFHTCYVQPVFVGTSSPPYVMFVSNPHSHLPAPSHHPWLLWRGQSSTSHDSTLETARLV